MSAHGTRLVDRQWVASGTLAVRLARPEGFAFQAGQYVDLTVVDPPFQDAQGPTRSLSIASGPSEPDLLLVMRDRPTAFKRSLRTLSLGSALLLEGPFDGVSLQCDAGRPLAFLAGGVGVAAFLPLLRECAAAGSMLPATLFYSNRHPEEAAFLDELRGMEGTIPGFRLVATMTRVSDGLSRWTGETEHLGLPLLRRYLPDLSALRYCIVGGARFVSQLRLALACAGVLSADIDIDLYTGY